MISIDRLKTTKLGEERIKKNLNLSEKVNVIKYIICEINNSTKTYKEGKNIYVECLDKIITINDSSHTVITAHLYKDIKKT